MASPRASQTDNKKSEKDSCTRIKELLTPKEKSPTTTNVPKSIPKLTLNTSLADTALDSDDETNNLSQIKKGLQEDNSQEMSHIPYYYSYQRQNHILFQAEKIANEKEALNAQVPSNNFCCRIT